MAMNSAPAKCEPSSFCSKNNFVQCVHHQWSIHVEAITRSRNTCSGDELLTLRDSGPPKPLKRQTP
eukprot:4152685-Amphidinium_carterae.2